MRLATWNVNSVRARHDRLIAWLRAHEPDVLCLQETKVEDRGFPGAALSELGYHSAIWGQRSYNGVAIVSRRPLTDIARGFADGGDDEQARVIAATCDGLRVICTYVPNGQAVGTDKYRYKLAWLARLRAWLDRTSSPSQPVILCGDMNVAPEDRDVHDPAAWAGQVLCSPSERAALRHVLDWGLEDVFRHHVPDGGHYSWWDYRGVSFFRNHGLRIDHVFATRSLMARSTRCEIDRNERKGQNPSDHAPVIAEFSA